TEDVAGFVWGVRDGVPDGYRPPGVALQGPPAHRDIPIVTPALVAAAPARGLGGHAWTIHDEGEVARPPRLGGDAVLTDGPGRRGVPRAGPALPALSAAAGRRSSRGSGRRARR